MGSSQNAGRGRGVFFFPKFSVLIFVVILLYCYFLMFAIFPSSLVQISQTNKEHTKATKGTSFDFRNEENFRLKLRLR